MPSTVSVYNISQIEFEHVRCVYEVDLCCVFLFIYFFITTTSMAWSVPLKGRVGGRTLYS